MRFFFWGGGGGLCFGGTERFSCYQNFTDLGSMRNSQSQRELSCNLFSRYFLKMVGQVKRVK